MLTPAFRIQELTELDPGTAYQFEFIWICRGEATLTVDFQQHVLSSNDVGSIRPGQWRWLAGTDSARGYYLSVSPGFFPTLKKEMDQFYVSRLTGERTGEIIQLMKKEYDRNGLTRMDVITGFLRIFLLYLSKDRDNEGRPRKWDGATERVLQYLEMVKNNFLEKKKVSDYARELSLTPAHLNYLVKKVSGFSAKYHIHQCIISEAKRLILTQDPGIKELAYSLGFCDCAHFSRYFKQVCGMKFSSFRQYYLKS